MMFKLPNPGVFVCLRLVLTALDILFDPDNLKWAPELDTTSDRKRAPISIR